MSIEQIRKMEQMREEARVVAKYLDNRWKDDELVQAKNPSKERLMDKLNHINNGKRRQKGGLTRALRQPEKLLQSISSPKLIDKGSQESSLNAKANCSNETNGVITIKDEQELIFLSNNDSPPSSSSASSQNPLSKLLPELLQDQKSDNDDDVDEDVMQYYSSEENNFDTCSTPKMVSQDSAYASQDPSFLHDEPHEQSRGSSARLNSAVPTIEDELTTVDDELSSDSIGEEDTDNSEEELEEEQLDEELLELMIREEQDYQPSQDSDAGDTSQGSSGSEDGDTSESDSDIQADIASSDYQVGSVRSNPIVLDDYSAPVPNMFSRSTGKIPEQTIELSASSSSQSDSGSQDLEISTSSSEDNSPVHRRSVSVSKGKQKIQSTSTAGRKRDRARLEQKKIEQRESELAQIRSQGTVIRRLKREQSEKELENLLNRRTNKMPGPPSKRHSLSSTSAGSTNNSSTPIHSRSKSCSMPSDISNGICCLIASSLCSLNTYKVAIDVRTLILPIGSFLNDIDSMSSTTSASNHPPLEEDTPTADYWKLFGLHRSNSAETSVRQGKLYQCVDMHRDNAESLFAAVIPLSQQKNRKLMFCLTCCGTYKVDKHASTKIEETECTFCDQKTCHNSYISYTITFWLDWKFEIELYDYLKDRDLNSLPQYEFLYDLTTRKSNYISFSGVCRAHLNLICTLFDFYHFEETVRRVICKELFKLKDSHDNLLSSRNVQGQNIFRTPEQAMRDMGITCISRSPEWTKEAIGKNIISSLKTKMYNFYKEAMSLVPSLQRLESSK
jgi:hypothetical protein